MILLQSSAGCEKALSLRAKVSHTWLDHEVMMVPTELALLRWQRNGWIGVQDRWQALHRIALDLADHLDDFSAARLVVRLPALASLPATLRDAMTAQLDAMHRELMDTPAIRASYMARLQALWNDSLHFFEMANRAYEDARADDFIARWQAVRDAASSLRAMFTSGEIPQGSLLP